MSMQHEAALITELFRQRSIRCRITGGYATPSYLCFRMEKDLAQDHKPLLGLASDIETHLHAYRARSGNLPANAQTSVRITLKPLAIEVNRPQPDALPFDAAMQRWPGEPHTALCGWTFDNGPKGEPLIWNLADPATAHAFVAGTTGSGKSNLLLAILKSLAWSTSPADLGLYIVDGGSADLMHLANLPHTVAFASDIAGAQDIIDQVAAIVDARKHGAGRDRRILLVVDELAALALAGNAKRIQTALAMVAQEGRKWNITLLLSTQKPMADISGSLAKSNISLRLVGAVTSKEDANTAADITGTGAERLPGRGAFIWRNGLIIRRFQAPLIDVRIGWVKRIRRRWAHIDAPAAPVSMPSTSPITSTEAAAAPRPSLLAPPPALLAVFQQYDDGRGAMRRGWKTAAVTALNNGDLPTGTTFQRLSDQAEEHLLTYFASPVTPVAPILRLHTGTK